MLKPIKILFLLIGLSCCLSSCFKNLSSPTLAYFNDFETGGDSSFIGISSNALLPKPYIDSFNKGHVLGRFWQTQLEFESPKIPNHNLVEVEFILNTHGYWEGNKLIGAFPDLWKIALDGQQVLSTTFSNSVEKQAYPSGFNIGAIPNPPRGNAWETDLPGVCALKGVKGGTVSYKITFSRPHTRDAIHLTINDQLHNTICDKSWSIDNLKITTQDIQ